MSTFGAKLQPRLPAGFEVPEPLERAWTWMEAQGWGRENSDGDYYLTPYAGDQQIGVVFSTDASLAGWFEPEDEGFDRLVPFVELDGSGGTGVLWLTKDGQVRVGGLSSEGEVSLLASDALEFLRLVAVGYRELDMFITSEQDDEEAKEAHAEFRAWFETEFGVDVPDVWALPDPDPFNKWVSSLKGVQYGTY